MINKMGTIRPGPPPVPGGGGGPFWLVLLALAALGGIAYYFGSH